MKNTVTLLFSVGTFALPLLDIGSHQMDKKNNQYVTNSEV